MTYYSDNDIEDNMCSCGRYFSHQHGMCSFCIDHWIEDNFITIQIREAGMKHGSDLGYDYGIRHTIYNEARDDYWILDDVDYPQYAYMDRRSYEIGFKDGYTTAYNSVYRRHDPMLKELVSKMNNRLFQLWVRLRFSNHPLFDPEILKMIRSFQNQNYHEQPYILHSEEFCE